MKKWWQQRSEVEQAFVSYDLGNGLLLPAGRYESMLGLEAKEPTGLYQYSTAMMTWWHCIPSTVCTGCKVPRQSGDISTAYPSR